jgi:hypothetical protein
MALRRERRRVNSMVSQREMNLEKTRVNSMALLMAVRSSEKMTAKLMGSYLGKKRGFVKACL